MPKFKDPKTGQIINVNSFLVFLCSLLFGMFFFLYIGETQHAIVMVGFAILTALVGIFISRIAILYALVFPLIYSFIAPKVVKDKWLNKGYIELEEQPLQPLTPKEQELIIWEKYIQGGYRGKIRQLPRPVYEKIIDLRQENPNIPDWISDDLRSQIIHQWNIDKNRKAKWLF